MQYFEAQSTAVAIPASRLTLRGRLHLPANANGLVLFAGALDNVTALAARWLREHLRNNAGVAA